MMTQLTRRSATKLIAAALGGAALPFSPSLAEATRKGGTIQFVLNSDPGIISALRAGNSAVYFISGKISEGLVRLGFDATPEPLLAESWTVSEDARTYTFKLRPGVKFHDGTPLTSRDVAVSLQVLKTTHPRVGAVLAGLEGVDTPDELTAVVRLARPVPYLLLTLQGSEAPILPAHLYEGKDGATNPANNHPIGTGPFLFKEWERGSHVILERNPEYWNGPAPEADRIVYRFVTDGGARAAAIEAGEAHALADTPISRLDRQRLEQSYPGRFTFETRGYVNSPFYTRLEFRLDESHLADLKVRQAIAHAVDRQKILDLAFLGQGSIATGPIQPGVRRFYEPEVTTYALDPAKAEALLEEAGYPRGANGERFRLRLVTYPGGSDYRSIADIVTQSLVAIGIGIDQTDGDVTSYINTIYTARAFDLNISTVGNGLDPAIGVQRLFWSKNIRPGVPFSNGSGYASPEVDRLLEEAAVEPAEAKRRELYSQFQKTVTADLPELALIASDLFDVVGPGLKDATIDGEALKGNFERARVEG